MRIIFRLILLVWLFTGCEKGTPPDPVGPLPSERQLAWHPLEYYGFIHFNMNTFTDMEWGTGGELPETFNPTHLDPKQWARIASEAGMKGLILTAKHHDGFCLWPTKTTAHSIANSPWKNGEGDLIADLAAACEEYGLKMGLYLSPWDRNNAAYGEPEYVEIFHAQLRELLTNYGPVFEVWFDGANGGFGYYGGANETRKIDNKTYYQWDKAIAIVRELQPQAVIFSDGGPDIRWVGNEEGWANETNWSIMRRDEIYPGWPRYIELRSGHEDGTHWLPAEADVSIRPGWYYHPSEDHRVKSLEKLVDIYYKSVGRNANLLLNIPVDNRGLIHETDSTRLMQLHQQIQEDFKFELAGNADISVSASRGEAYGSPSLNDKDPTTYWATPDEIEKAEVTVDFGQEQAFNRLVLQETIALGQRVQEFSVEVWEEGAWKEIDHQTTIGYKRILRLPDIKSSKLRINVLKAKGPVCLSNLEVYNAPDFLTQPLITRTKSGEVSILVSDKDLKVMVNPDASNLESVAYEYDEPFLLEGPATISAWAMDRATGSMTTPVIRYFDIPKKDWTIYGNYAQDSTAVRAIDDNEETFWATPEGEVGDRALSVDLGDTHTLRGFTYWPMQERWAFGHITRYSFYVSENGTSWKNVAMGEFSNIVNSPVEQNVTFPPVRARYIKLKADEIHGDDPRASFGEIGVLTE